MTGVIAEGDLLHIIDLISGLMSMRELLRITIL